jgi:hypothetical protein
VTRAARLLEAVAARVALLLVAVFTTGGFTVAGRPFTRADEFVILLAVIVALRALAAPLPLPTVSAARIAVVDPPPDLHLSDGRWNQRVRPRPRAGAADAARHRLS